MLKADDRSYGLDCSGALLAIYYRAGIDLEKCYTGYEGNGVKRLYSALRDNKLIYNAKIPAAGDIIIWDNTYDRNEDREFNDYFTHVGMVVDVDRDGTITYAHHNYRLGIVYEKMNLLHPNSTELNSPMRMRGSPPRPGRSVPFKPFSPRFRPGMETAEELLALRGLLKLPFHATLSYD